MKTTKFTGHIEAYLTIDEAARQWLSEQTKSEQIDIYNEFASDEGFESIYDFDESTINELFPSSYESARAFHFGTVDWTDEYFTFNGYGNIETISDLSDFISLHSDNLIGWLKENRREEIEAYQEDENNGNATTINGVEVLIGEEGQIMMLDAKTINDYIRLKQIPETADGEIDGEAYQQNQAKIRQICNPQEIYFHEINNYESFFEYSDREAVAIVRRYFRDDEAAKLARIY